MERREYPTTTRGWLKRMNQDGQSDRPVVNGIADLECPDTAPDIEGIKPERAALSAILSTRAYQRARGVWVGSSEVTTLPHTRSSDTFVQLRKKSDFIGSAFVSAMALGLSEDEMILQRPDAHPKAQAAYQRLDTILAPLQEHNEEPIAYRIDNTIQIIDQPSVVFLDIYGGLKPLPRHIDNLLATTAEIYKAQHGTDIDIATALTIAENSYDSYIKPVASLHKSESYHFIRLDVQRRQSGTRLSLYTLEDDQLSLSAETTDLLAQHKGGLGPNRSRTTRCPFLTKASTVKDFLDHPPDFDEPMQDAFQIHMRLLAA